MVALGSGWSQEAQRVSAREFLHYGQSSPLARVTHYLAVNQSQYGDDGCEDGDDAAPCQWESMLQSMPANRAGAQS